MSQTNSKPSSVSTDFTWFCEEWLKLKKRFIETKSLDDLDMYKFFLNEIKDNFTKLYLKSEKESWIALYEQILTSVKEELRYCKLAENNIKSNKHENKT